MLNLEKYPLIKYLCFKGLECSLIIDVSRQLDRGPMK